MHQRQHLCHAAADFAFRQFVLLQAKSDVLFHRHVRKQRVRLEHHVNGPLIRRHVGQILTIQHNLATAGNFKAGQHPQQRGLATAGSAQQCENFAFVNGQADIIHGVLAVKRFRQVADFQQRR